MSRAALLCVLAACGSHSPGNPVIDAPGTTGEPALGAHYLGSGDVRFRIASTRATRIELAIYDAPLGAERLRVPLEREPGSTTWRAQVPAASLPPVVYYGYRVWGPNWPYDPTWQPGSNAGWITDVDGDGNRMNPNKLVFDPYAAELSHDPTTPDQPDGSFYATGSHRDVDSGPVAPKGIVLHDERADTSTRPTRAFRDEIIYEVHLRGFTKNAAGACAGTYAGAAARADYIAGLGVSAIELLPIEETPNDRNDVDPNSDSGDNYWGYSTLAYFAPDRRYACDRSPGGPTRELRDMVRAFHDRGVKVYLDIVYNHTSEGSGGSLVSLRGIDNAGYYQLDRAGTGFTSSNGVGADLAGDKPLVAALVVDSLTYWRDALGIDGFRFDLAPVLGNTCGPQCFTFDRNALPATIAQQLARPADGGDGVDLIAEPWGVVPGSYQVGQFPAGWASWNDHFRDGIRKDQNAQGTIAITPGWIADWIAGTTDLFRHDGLHPAAGVSYLDSHDGFTLADLYACNASNNGQAWPYGPSGGGTTANYSWDHGGDPVAQRQAARTGLALLMLSAGVPMIVGGDEKLHSQHCNNNPYNVDSPAMWLDWTTPEGPFTTFARRLMQFRAAHPALRPADWRGSEISWRDETGNPVAGSFMDDATKPVLAWQLDGRPAGDVRAFYVLYNRSAQTVIAMLPPPPDGLAWYRVADTGWGMEATANIAAPGSEPKLGAARYDIAPRTLALFIAK